MAWPRVDVKRWSAFFSPLGLQRSRYHFQGVQLIGRQGIRSLSVIRDVSGEVCRTDLHHDLGLESDPQWEDHSELDDCNLVHELAL